MAMTYWTNEMILELIKLYEKEECLWNYNHENHKCRSTINKAWTNMSIALEIHPAEIRRKMKNLVSQFNRECRNLQTVNRNKSTEKISKWFAYEPLFFLLKRNKNGLHEGQSEENSDLDISFSECETDSHNYVPEEIETPKFEIISVKNEITDDIPQQSDEKENESSSEHITSSTSYHVLKKNCSPPPENTRRIIPSLRYPRVTRMIRKRRIDDEERKELLRKICRDKNKDECEIFGELVTCKLRSLNNFARNKVEHLISNILWEASLGKFDQLQNESSDDSTHVENTIALKK